MNYTINDFVCPECGQTIPLPRRKGKVREKGHIKDLWCPFCQKIQKTREYRLNRGVKTLDGEKLGWKWN